MTQTQQTQTQEQDVDAVQDQQDRSQEDAARVALDEERARIACAIWHAGDPDGQTVRIRSAWRDLGCSGSGPEAYRRVRYPGAADAEWPDAPRLPRCDGRAGTRRAAVHCDVPVGSIVVTYSRDVYKGRRGRCSVEVALVTPPDPEAPGTALLTLPHRTLRSRPVYEATLPDGSVVEIARREAS